MDAADQSAREKKGYGDGLTQALSLVVGPVLGVVAFVVAVRIGAGLFRTRQADLFQDLVSMR